MKKIIVLLSGLLLSTATLADHSWGNFHWGSTVSPFQLTLINSTQNEWDSYVTQAVSDWSNSSKLSIVETNGSTSGWTRYFCQGGSGTMRICNYAYGYTGWLGVAGISYDSNSHITSANTKMNDTYYAWAYYDTPEWRQSVLCQEIGHDVGLHHQDEDFNNQSLFSCMDYQDPPFEYPNAHDYEQLETIYNHTDSSSTIAAGSGNAEEGCRGRRCVRGQDNPNQFSGHPSSGNWGRSAGRRGNGERFVRIDRQGNTHVTFVYWVEGHGTDDGHGH